MLTHQLMSAPPRDILAHVHLCRSPSPPAKVNIHTYIYIYLTIGGRKPAAARRVSLFLAGVAAQDTWSAACEPAVPRMQGTYVMVMEGAEKQAGRLWDKFGMKEVVKEKGDTLYVGVGHHHKAMACIFVTRRKVCVLWKLEGDISVSEGEITV